MLIRITLMLIVACLIGAGSLAPMPGYAAPVSAPVSAPGARIGVPSRWQGQIQGMVFNQPFRLPLIIDLQPPMRMERNPVHLFLGAGNDYQVGGLQLHSALSFAAPSGGNVTLQYFNVGVRGSQLRAVLVNDQASAAAAINGFTGPNVTALTAPPVMRGVYESLGPTEIFIFAPGAEVTIQFNGNQLTGTVRGVASTSLVGIFPTPEVVYTATFSARQVR